jgi:hypothetical protein
LQGDYTQPLDLSDLDSDEGIEAAKLPREWYEFILVKPSAAEAAAEHIQEFANKHDLGAHIEQIKVGKTQLHTPCVVAKCTRKFIWFSTVAKKLKGVIRAQTHYAQGA